ncbi:hypothetical protein ABXN37_14720 [Piscinibacter sakaiensis]
MSAEQVGCLRADGAAACRAGSAWDHNPHPRDSQAYLEWLRGWVEADRLGLRGRQDLWPDDTRADWQQPARRA